MQPNSLLTRRSALMLATGVAAGVAAFAVVGTRADAGQTITVHKHPQCGCCVGWVRHMQQAGFTVKTGETTNFDAVKRRLGVPPELASCHTAQIAGYVLEGHVPAAALKRLLAEKPNAVGLAVPRMPVGSPGMEGGTPEKFDVILFGPDDQRRTYMSFVGDQIV